uniref:Phosphatase binding protein n=1 Tax=Ackermannviridae sp. TaxID=2831612 RepID=A0A8S5VXN4_9CAUD|nr:MAG TPA: phosphatase binding protein [Ackermannviridae sp.]
MVPKGLKVGDTFEDGGRLYVVEAVNGNGTYFSRAVENSPPRPAATPLASDGGKGKRRTKKQ